MNEPKHRYPAIERFRVRVAECASKRGRELRLGLPECLEIVGEVQRLLLLVATMEEENNTLRKSVSEGTTGGVLFDGGTFGE